MIQRKAKARKPKPGWSLGSAVWYSREYRLGKDRQRALVTLCALTDQQESTKMLRQVALALGIFSDPAAHQALDGEPRPNEYAEAYERIGAHAAALRGALESLPPRIREQLDAWLIAPDVPLWEAEDRPTATESLQMQLERFTGAAQELGTRNRDETSPGRPLKHSQRLLYSSLRDIFKRFYKGPKTIPRTQGGPMFPSEQRKREEKFVRLAIAELGSPAER